MSRSKKKTTISQKLVGLSVSGMPAPVQKVFSGRIAAGLIVLLFPLLLATGIVTVHWENGRPRLSINQQKAEVAKEKAVERINELRAQNPGSFSDSGGAIQTLTGQQHSATGLVSEWGQPQGTVSSLTERVEKLTSSESQSPSSTWNWLPHTATQGEPPAANSGPLSSLKQRFNSRR